LLAEVSPGLAFQLLFSTIRPANNILPQFLQNKRMNFRTLFRSIFLLLFLVIGLSHARPKLVIVISIDQFPYDYLTRYREYFTEEKGFRFLLDSGAVFANATYKHALNMTGPGHAVISTGCYGNVNGIFSNSWYDRTTQEEVYCVNDPRAKPVGASTGAASPSRLLTTTIGDQLRIATGFASKVISVSLKDRSAVLLGGKLPNGAYWLMDSLFMTSSYYMDALPSWVDSFNSSGTVRSYLGKSWERALPKEAYKICDVDDASYEGEGSGLGRTFPHPVNNTSALRTSPFGNEVLSAFAGSALQGEALGKRGVTDLLCVGFSSNDYVGHMYGPNSQEVLDMTVRTDHVLADFFSFVDKEIGLAHCLILLTSDHGITPIPEYIQKEGRRGWPERVNEQEIVSYGNRALSKAFGLSKGNPSWIEHFGDGNIYLRHDLIIRRKLEIEEVAKVLARTLREQSALAMVLTRDELMSLSAASMVERRLKNSFHMERSGDLVFAYKPHMISNESISGTTHGQPYDYDAHVPVIFYGDRIVSGTYYTEASPADIAPTLAVLLGIGSPAGRDGRVLAEAMRDL
jgi:predicted AlkP superfamily pyrophosphatase or phosphodiesterase